MNNFKKLDIVIIVFLMVLSFTPHLIFSKTLSKNYDSSYANIRISGDIYDTIPLSEHTGEETFVVKTPSGDNTISVKDNTVQIIDADCHDALCVKQGVASKVGESIICLPNELIIEIKGDKSDSKDDIILSH